MSFDFDTEGNAVKKDVNTGFHFDADGNPISGKPEGAFSRAWNIAKDSEGGVLPAMGSLMIDALPKGGKDQGWLANTAIDIARAPISFSQTITGIGNLGTVGGLGKLLDLVGYNPQEAQRLLTEHYGDSRKQSMQDISQTSQSAEEGVKNAEGFWNTTGAVISGAGQIAAAMARNPGEIQDQVIQMLPDMLFGAGIVGKVGKSIFLGAAKESGIPAERAIALLAGDSAKTAAEASAIKAGNKAVELAATKLSYLGHGIEGAQAAGQNASQIRAENPDDIGAQMAQVPAGILTGLIGRLASKVPGFGDVQTAAELAIAGPKGAAAKLAASGSLPMRIFKGAVSEGILQELPQSAQEQIWQNIGQGKPWDEGVLTQGAQGAIVGAVMGAGGGGMAGKTAPQNAPQETPQVAEPTLGLPHYTGEPMVVFPDGSTMTRAEAEQHRLDGMVKPVGPADILAAQDLDSAIAAAKSSISQPVHMEGAPAVFTGRGAEHATRDLAYDAAEQQILDEQRADYAKAEQQRRDADFDLAEQQRQDQAVAQANAITQAQGFNSTEPTAIQLAMQRALERKNSVLPAPSRPDEKVASADQSTGRLPESGLSPTSRDSHVGTPGQPSPEVAQATLDARPDVSSGGIPTPQSVPDGGDERAEPAPSQELEQGGGESVPVGTPDRAHSIGEFKYNESQARLYAARMTKQGLESMPVQSVDEPGKWAILTPEEAKAYGEQDQAPATEAILLGRPISTVSDQSLNVAAKSQSEAGENARQEIQRRRRSTPLEDERLNSAETRAVLESMPSQAGWAEVGGRLIRDVNGQASGRTTWIPKAEWFSAGMGNEKFISEAVRKALAGEPMKAAEKRTVQAMIDWAHTMAHPALDEFDTNTLADIGALDDTPNERDALNSVVSDIDDDRPLTPEEEAYFAAEAERYEQTGITARPMSADEVAHWLGENDAQTINGNDQEAGQALAGESNESSASGERTHQGSGTEEEFALAPQTRQDLEGKEARANDEGVANREAADRERDVFALYPQVAPKVQGATQQKGLFTPDGRASKDAETTSQAPSVEGVSTSGNGKVEEPSLQYPHAEQIKPGAYTKDLFGDPIPAKAGMRTSGGIKPYPAEGRDILSAAGVPGAKFATVATQRQTGSIKSAVDRVTNAANAAHVFAGLRKSPQEVFSVLVLDKNQKPISVLHLAKGATTQTSVYPEVVTKAVYETPGAASVWYAHNHPSGIAEPSTADERLTGILSQAFGPGTGIKVDGHVIIAGQKAAMLEGGGNRVGSSFDIPAGARTHSIPIAERTFLKTGKLGDAITSSADARQRIPRIADGKTGVVFVDIQNTPVAFLPLEAGRMEKLRDGESARLLFGAAARSNASGAIVNFGNGESPTQISRSINNLHEALTQNRDIRVLDAISGGKSLAEMGLEGSASKRGEFESRAPIFYSQLSRAIEAAPEKIFTTGKNVKLWLDSNAGKLGVKKDEIEATGVKDWLDLQAGKVSKEQVQEFLKNNGVKVEEVTLGEPSEKQAEYERRRNEIENLRDRGGQISAHEAQRRLKELRQELGFDEFGQPVTKTKFHTYQLPGGENYRELLLTLPAKEPARAYELRSMDGRTLAEDAELQRLEKKSTAFISPHFDQPNILAHVRFNERTDSDGKRVLFLEELQSDWAQKGRKEGFDKKQYRVVQKGTQNLAFASGDNLPSMEAATEAIRSHRENHPSAYHPEFEIIAAPLRPTVPSAPFVGKTEAWTALALKRMIRYAAENGFDRIAWANGTQQAARYDLSKQIKHINYQPDGDKFKVMAVAHGGQVALDQKITAAELPDIVGKEVAQKIIDGAGDRGISQIWPDQKGPYKRLSGLDLKVGGEGMKGFYDKIVPAVANDVLKKLGGGKVGEIELPGIAKGEGNGLGSVKQPGFDITPALREKVMAGMPLFSKSEFRQIPIDSKGPHQFRLRIAQKARDDFVSAFKGAEALDIRVVNSRDEIRGDTRPSPYADGVYYDDKGRIYLIADNIADWSHAIRILLHEAVGHYGLSTMMGERFQALKDAALKIHAEDDVSHVQPGDKDWATIEAVRRDYPEVSDDVAAQEVLARMAETPGPVPTLLARAMFHVRLWLRDIAKKIGVKWDWKLEEIRQVIGMANDYMRRGDNRLSEGIGGEHGLVYSSRSEPIVAAAGPRPTFVANPEHDGQGPERPNASGSTQSIGKLNDEGKPPLESRSEVIGDSGRTYTPAQERAFSNTGRIVQHLTPAERIQALWKDAGKKMAQGIFDQFAPVKDIDAHAYTLLRLSKGATGAFEALMHHGKLSIKDGAFDADTSGGVMEQVFFPIGKESTDFLYWVAGNRAERLMAEGKENLFTPADIAAYKSLSNGVADFDYTLANGRVTRDRTLIYADTLRKFNEFNKNVLDMAEQSGLIDGASRGIWESEFYVPFYRVAEDDGVRGVNVKQGVVRQEAFKKLKGGTDGLNDLLSNTLMNWAHLIDASAKNRAATESLDAAERLGAARKAIPGEKKTVWAMKNGQKVEYKIDDPYLMTALQGLEFSGLRGPAMNVLSATKHWLTIGVTASPFFKVRNLIRDSVQAIGTSELGLNPVENVKQGWKLTDRDSQEYVSALAGGGLIRFGTMLESNEASRTRQLIKRGAKDSSILNNESKLRAFYDRWMEPAIMAYNELGNRGEEINRMALYDQLIKNGMDHATASLMARDLMDFSLQGSFTTIRFLSQVVPFFNARLQGMYKLGRAAKEDPAKMATVFGVVAMLSLSLLAAYHDDDDWKRREEWDRDSYWWFKIGGEAFRIPKPFEIGAMATLTERSAEFIFDNEMTGKRFRERVMRILSDQLSMNPIPQLLKPIADIYANKDSFRGQPIESMGMERLSPDYRYRSGTSMLARGLSTAGQNVTSAIGIDFLSPVQIDYAIRGYFSWLGAFAVGTADLAIRSASDEPARPTMDYWKLATGGMVSGLDGAQSRYVSQMYDQAKELEQAYATWRQLVKEGKVDDAAEYRADHTSELKTYRKVEGVKRKVAAINERIRMTERSNLDPDVKRDRINLLRAQQDQIARQLVD